MYVQHVLQVHILSRRMVAMGLMLLKHLPLNMVDTMMAMLGNFFYGDLTKFGINRPTDGPFFMKIKYGKYPVIDVGTYQKIKSGEIQVCQQKKLTLLLCNINYSLISYIYIPVNVSIKYFFIIF